MINHYNCIYMYTNLINGKRYVGKAKDFNKRHIKVYFFYFYKKVPLENDCPQLDILIMDNNDEKGTFFRVYFFIDNLYNVNERRQ